MKVQAQICMVINLDKCIGCLTCSVTCKNVWTSRKGMEYAWFNNVETKPGIGYPKKWEDQEKWQGGWEVKDGKAVLRHGSRPTILGKLFSSPRQPEVKDYYEPFTFDFDTLKQSLRRKTAPTARPYSIATGKRMDKVEDGPNWEDNLAGPFAARSADPNLKGTDTVGYEEFEASFMFYLPRLCEHCLHPSCAASCPSGAIYKRSEDGVVLIDQDKCRGWRQCISACPYKKINFNPARNKSEKCIFCYPRIESGEPTICSESCVGRVRYLGVVLFDAEKIEAYSAAPENELYERQLDLILDPFDPEVQRAALRDGVSQNFIDAAQNSPTYKLMKEWKIAFPLHPEYRTLPMVWYVPPPSPLGHQDVPEQFFAGIDDMRIPLEYLARLLTAGDQKVIREALGKLVALRIYMRGKTLGDEISPDILEKAGVTPEELTAMYKLLAIADYKDRFVIPTAPAVREEAELFALRTGLGFEGEDKENGLFGGL